MRAEVFSIAKVIVYFHKFIYFGRDFCQSPTLLTAVCCLIRLLRALSGETENLQE